MNRNIRELDENDIYPLIDYFLSADQKILKSIDKANQTN